ncbi:response to cold, partial [Stylosanthes scabra]|nr:response to cold [Stylosanthes scabra]
MSFDVLLRLIMISDASSTSSTPITASSSLPETSPSSASARVTVLSPPCLRPRCDEIQWPFAKDEIAIKVDDSHYFFSFRPPKGSEFDSDSDEEDWRKHGKDKN